MSRPIIGYIVDAATRLFTSRKIGGVDFDGTKDINLPGVNQPGNQNTSGNAASATRLQTARKIGGVDFNGTEDITLPGVNAMGNQSTSGNAASATRLQTGRRINGTLFNGTADIITQQWGSERSITVGNTTRSVDGSENITWTLEDIGVGTVGRLNTNGNLTNFLRGDGTWAHVEVRDTTYTAGDGLTLNGTEFSLPVSVVGTGSFVTGVEQTSSGLRISLGTPPDTNTTYTEVTEAEITAGTSATLRAVTGRRMKFAVDTFGLKLGTTANTAKPGNWLPNASEIPALDTSKITTGIFPLARLPDSGVSAGTYGSALEIPIINVDVKGRITALSTANIPTATTGVAGLTRLSTAVNSSATNMAATPSAVKQAYDLANAAIPASRIGIAGGIAPLDEHGLLAAEFLPSFVDDVLEFADYDSLPTTGERGKIYVTVDNDRIFRWSGTGYIWINQSSSSSDTAVRLATTRTISMTGDGTWSVPFDGSTNASGVLTLANTGVIAGSHGSQTTIPVVTVDSKGRVTGLTSHDIRTATTGRTGVVQLNDTLTSTSATQALTAAQGKVLQDTKVDKVTGKELSTNDFTNALLDKLTNIQAGAQVNVPTNLSIGGSGNDRTIVSSTGNNAALPLATANTAGLMSIADRAKLDGLDNYTAGPGLTLTGRQFSLPVETVGTGTFIESVEQTASGIKITKGTPPNTNTTYAEIPEAEVTAGTASTARSISGRRLKQAVDVHGLKLGSTADTARPGNWVPTWNEVDAKPAFIGAGTTQAAARAAIGAGTSSLTLGTAAGTAAAGNDSRINNGQTAFGWGNHSLAGYVKTDTKYTAGDGITLTGNVFSLPVSVSGSGTFVTNVIQTSNGIEIQLGTPPNTNTTYAEIPEAEVTAGTAATLRTISARRLKFAIDTHGLSLGTTASTAKAGNWLPSWDDVTGKPVVIAAGATQAAARQAIGAGTSDLVLGTAAGTAAAGNDSRLSNSREWTASTVTQAEAEAGTATTRRAWTAQRVRQAAIAAWNSVTSAWGRGLVNSADAAAGRAALGLGTAATFNSGLTGGLVATSARTAERVSYSGTSSEPTVKYSFGGATGGWARGILTANLEGDTQTYGGFWFGLLGNASNYTRGVIGFGNDSNWWQTAHQISLYEGKDPTVGTSNTIFHMGNLLKGTGSDDDFPMSQKAVTDALATKANTSTQVIAGTGLSGGGNLSANRTLNVQYGTTAGTAAQGNDSRINNGQTAFGWGNHATAGYVKTDTKYTAGSGLTLSGTAFSLPVSVSGSGTFVTSVSQTEGGIAVTLGTPPNTNTTYAEITEAEVTAGTAATLRTISGRRLKLAVDTHGLKIGTTASTAKAGNWTPSASEIPNLDASKITSGVFAAARIPTLNQNTTGSAAKLTTARTLTIGNSGKAFDGSANIAWTLAEIGAADRTISIAAGTGLGGGGNLTANRTISIGSGVTPLTAEALSDRDLNTVQTPGYYYQGANANATAARNYPLGDGGQAGTLVVTTAAGVVQEYTTYGPNNRKFTRGMYSDTWSAWKELGAGGASSWSELTGKPSTFPPSTHTHTIAQVSGLQSAIDAKVNVSGNQTISGTKDFSGVLRATGTANATSATSGSLRSSGGLGVASNIFAGGNITAYSDIRRKKDIVTIDGALDIILKARGVYYTRKDTGAKEVGFIAQEMQKILPRVVGGAEETGLGISYGNITAVLAEAVKTVYNDHVTPAKERISQLEDQNQKLIERLERLEALVSNKLLNEE